MSIFSFLHFETASAALLVGAVLIVGVLHTMVPDHWVPITLIARQRGWSRGETARAALQAGTGHVATTLILAAIVWLAGVAIAARFGHWIDTISSVALVGFGLWIAISSWFDLRSTNGHGHGHGPHGHTHYFSHLATPDDAVDRIHGPELQRMHGKHGVLSLSIYEYGQPPRFRLTSTRPKTVGSVTVETRRADGARQSFAFVQQGGYWESVHDIPEPHGFDVKVTVGHENQGHSYSTMFAEHEHEHGNNDEHAHNHGSSHGATKKNLIADSAADSWFITDGGRHPGILCGGKVRARSHCHHGARIRGQYDPDLRIPMRVFDSRTATR